VGALGGDVSLGAASTIDVGAEVAALEPVLFEAVTPTRSVLPTSSSISVYVLLFAPGITTQLPPVLSQRSH
jgi:hypothetical protein